ncbi:hypothetical protein [Pseudoxanthomonas sp. JBR18]|uniref:hypothetical protein n=1 Tax=Pseudoxanthomonas sp. JBR18 TaxID=2969308 RepID=UPI0023062E44|nr:hypothetical protein [Pseudoxanthomonas sp. JBR18]WCE06108.1 hypothetical protein PJ250_09240 [Pseudoxanthomonas sp. JBR18]
MKTSQNHGRGLGVSMRAFALAVLLVACWPFASAQAQTGCTAGACVSAGPRLVSVDSTQGPLLNLLFRLLLPGTTVNASVLDWNALAQSDVNLNALITQLGANLGLSDTSQILNSQLTLAQLRLALVQVAQADGNTAAVSALNALSPALSGLSGTVRLSNLLQVSLPQGSLADIDLDLLDVVTGSVQLYNFSNVATTPQPITVDTAALGLSGVTALQLWAQVVEPPTYVCGGAGSAFHTGAIRIKLNAQAISNFDLASLRMAINGLGVSNTQLSASVLTVQAYADIARAEGTITAVDGLANTVSFTGRPGLVNLYIGSIPDATFFNRSQVITSAVVTPTTLTTLNLRFQTSVLGLGLVTAQVPLAVQAKAAATGSPGMQSFTVSAPFPQTRTASAGTVSAGSLITSLLQNLTLTTTAGAVSATLLGSPITTPSAVTTLVGQVVSLTTSTLSTQVVSLLTPILNTVLGGLVDNLLALLGIRIGEAVFTVEGIARSCAVVLSLQKVLAPTNDAGRFDLNISTGGSVVASASNVGNGGTTTPFVTTPQSTYALAEAAANGTILSRYTTTWSCADQDNNSVASGAGTSFEYVAPALSNVPTTVVCRITNSARLADLSVTKSDASSSYTPGGGGTYVITVSNAGPADVTGAVVNDTLPTGAALSGPWACASTGGGSCPASGGSAGGTVIAISVNLPAGAQAVINVPVSYSADAAGY